MSEVACLLYFILYDRGQLLFRRENASELRQCCCQSQTVPFRVGDLSGNSLLSMRDCSHAHVKKEEQQSFLSHGLYFASPDAARWWWTCVCEVHVFQAEGMLAI